MNGGRERGRGDTSCGMLVRWALLVGNVASGATPMSSSRREMQRGCALHSDCGGQLWNECGTSCPLICGVARASVCNMMCNAQYECPYMTCFDEAAGVCQTQTWSPDDSCQHTNDGYCDEPYGCEMGTDTTDCSQEGFGNGNNRYCQYTDDGACDEIQHCPAGSDTHDCCHNGEAREIDALGKAVVADQVCCDGNCSVSGDAFPPVSPDVTDPMDDMQYPGMVLVIIVMLGGSFALLPVMVMLFTWCCCIKPMRDRDRRPTRKAWSSCCGLFWIVAALGLLLNPGDVGPLLWLLGSVLMIVPFCRDESYTEMPHDPQQPGAGEVVMVVGQTVPIQATAAQPIQATVVQPITSHNPVLLAPDQQQLSQQRPAVVEAEMAENTSGGSSTVVSQPLPSVQP